MDKIISVFRPWVDADPDLDMIQSAKFGWVCIDTSGPEVFAKFATDRPEFLAVICAWFFDRAEAPTWKGAVAQAMKDMEPYTSQLPQEDVDKVETIMGLYVKFEEKTAP